MIRPVLNFNIVPQSNFTIKGDRMNYSCFDADSEPPCADSECICGAGYVVGNGATPEEAIEDFWEQWEDNQ